MLKRNKDGLYYVSEIGRKYELDSGSCINADRPCTSDICYILDSGFTEEDYYRWESGEIERTDDNTEVFVGFFYGATFLTDEKYKEEYTGVIKEIVNHYESKRKEEKVMEKKEMRTVSPAEFITRWKEMEDYWVKNDGDADENSYYNRIINQNINIELPLLGIKTGLFWCPPTVECFDDMFKKMIEETYVDLLVEKEQCVYTGGGLWLAEVPFEYGEQQLVMVVDNEHTDIWAVYQNVLKDNGKWESVEHDELLVESLDANHILPDFQIYYIKALQLLAERIG